MLTRTEQYLLEIFYLEGEPLSTKMLAAIAPYHRRQLRRICKRLAALEIIKNISNKHGGLYTLLDSGLAIIDQIKQEARGLLVSPTWA